MTPGKAGLRRSNCRLDGILPRGTFSHLSSSHVSMAKTSEQIDTTAKQIYALACQSENPISVMCLQCTILLGRADWTPKEVELVSSEVLTLLIHQGLKEPDG
jgi:hypothetical protein